MIRADIQALPSHAIRAAMKAWNAEWKTPSGTWETADQKFREALAAVLPQEAGAPTLQDFWNGDVTLTDDQRRWMRQALDVQDRGASRAPSEAAPRDGSPEYREALIAAANEALATAPFHATIEDPTFSGRLVGALLKRGLRIMPIPAGSPAFREAPPSDAEIVNVICDAYNAGRFDNDAAAVKVVRDWLRASRPEGDGAV